MVTILSGGSDVRSLDTGKCSSWSFFIGRSDVTPVHIDGSYRYIQVMVVAHRQVRCGVTVHRWIIRVVTVTDGDGLLAEVVGDDIHHSTSVSGRSGSAYVNMTLRWHHNDHAGVSNHQPHGCLLNRLFRRTSKKTSKLRVTGLCAGNSPGTGEFPAQMASYAENVSIWWRHHDLYILSRFSPWHPGDVTCTVRDNGNVFLTDAGFLELKKNIWHFFNFYS